jgi:hypothetical protein
MKWIGKEPPSYIWRGDSWYNEKDKCTYEPNFEDERWECFVDPLSKVIPFPKKTKLIVSSFRK